MGKRTSVYLPGDVAALAAASPLTLAELVTRGLACTGHATPAAPRARGMVAGELCRHPRARVHRGLCGACGVNVG